MSDHGVVHFEIGGPDGKALADFYGKLFGWTIDANNPMNYGMVFKMDNGIGGGLPQSEDGSSFVTVYITCGDDVAGMLAKAEGLGATKALDVTNLGGDAPTIASFHDPDGNLIGLVNGNPNDPSPFAGKGAPVTWFEIAGKDGAKAQDFYRKLFGWEISADNPMNYGETPHIGLGIGGGIYGAGDDTAVRVYAEVSNLEGTLKKVGELGGKTVAEPMDVPGGPTIAQFSDIAGNVIGLILAGSGQAQ